MRLFGNVLLANFVFGFGCSSPGGQKGQEPVPTCTDQDADDYGVGDACRGPDCDDSNPTVFEQADCEALCTVDDHSTGCACDHAGSPQPEICYLGDPTLLTIGVCRSGFRVCNDEGYWTECMQQVLPTDESCDEVDNDCDGEVDEGVTNDCGNCAPECFRDCVGVDCADFQPDDEGDNVENCDGDPDCITLGEVISLDVIWITNTSDGTVTKVNTESREVEGRYILTSFGRTYQAYPSRTSVDFRGDVFVANRAYGYMSSVTKVANDECPAGETSSGPDDVLAWGDDACVLWNTEIGSNAVAMAIASENRVGLDGPAEERVWVGSYNRRIYYEIDSTDGELTGEEADCNPCYPYGAGIDKDGRLWSGCASSNLCTFETESPDDVEIIAEPGGYNYTVAFDEEGRVWTGGTCANYDPEEEEWTMIPNCSSYSVAADLKGSVWYSSSYCNGSYGTCRVDIETNEMTAVGATSYGIAIDFDGFVWAIPSYQTGVYVIDPGGGAGDEDFERIELGLSGPDTQTDMTGYQLRSASGRYNHVFEGCDEDVTEWTALLVDADTPTDTEITVEVRTASTLAALSAQRWIPIGSVEVLGSPIDLAEFLTEPPHARFIEVQFRLSTDGDARPTIRRFEMQWICDIGIG